jgi:hypothetical protein
MMRLAPFPRLSTAGRLRVRDTRRRRPAVDNQVSAQLITYTPENFVQRQGTTGESRA